MHELAAAQDILKTALAAAEAEGAQRIRTIVLKLGRIYGADDIESLVEMLARGTIAEGARLEIEPVPGAVLQVESLEVE